MDIIKYKNAGSQMVGYKGLISSRIIIYVDPDLTKQLDNIIAAKQIEQNLNN